MDYKAFYDEVVNWIQTANQMAVKHGVGHELFWRWVTESSAELCRRYEDNPLVIKQMMMLADWLEDVCESR